MNFHGDSGQIDNAKFLEYIQKQFANDLAVMLATKEELTLRQGALSAAKAALDDREAAGVALTQAKEMTKVATEKAKAVTAKAAEKDADVEAKIKAHDAHTKKRESELSEREAKLAAREGFVKNLQKAHEDFAIVLTDRETAINAAQVALDARIKAFQEKVAALTA